MRQPIDSTNMTTGLRLSAALAALLITIACSGDDGPRATGQATTTAPFGTSAPAEDSGPEEHLLYAQRLLLAHYVDEPDPLALLEAAWTGVLKEARKAFAPPAGVHFSTRGSNPAAADEDFARTVRTLVSIAPSDLDVQKLVFAGLEAMAESLNDNHTFFMLPTSSTGQTRR
jgi:hypothetical protein